MKKLLCGFAALALILFASCGGGATQTGALNTYMEENGHLKVLATTAMIADIAARIGGEYVDVIPLIKGEIDPHSYELVKGDDEKLTRADLIFYNGLGLEHGPSLKGRLEKNDKAIAVGDYLKQNHSDDILYVGGAIDPHIWLDMALWIDIIQPIKEALIQKRPLLSVYFEENACQLREEIQAVHQEISGALQAIPEEKRYLVTSHDAFNYFTKRYLSYDKDQMQDWEKRHASPEGLAPEGQLSLSDIQRLVDYILAKKVTVVFPESNVSKDSLKKIIDACRLKGYDLRLARERLYGDAMKQSQEGYLGMMKHNASVLIEEWEKN